MALFKAQETGPRRACAYCACPHPHPHLRPHLPRPVLPGTLGSALAIAPQWPSLHAAAAMATASPKLT